MNAESKERCKEIMRSFSLNPEHPLQEEEERGGRAGGGGGGEGGGNELKVRVAEPD